MPYATRQQMVDRFGENAIAMLEDLNGMGLPEPKVTENALLDASDLAESYLGLRYPLPLPSVPSVLAGVVCDIARYKLYTEQAPDEVRKRFEDGVSWLKRLADNKAVLFFEAKKEQDPTAVNALNNLEVVNKPKAGRDTAGVFSDAVFNRM